MTLQITEAPPGAWDGPTVDVEVGAGSAAAALTVASDLSVKSDFAPQVGFLLQHVGPRVVGASLGLKDPRQLTKWWRTGVEPKGDGMLERVYLLFQVSYAVTWVFDGATAARFLRVRSPYLGYVAPGDVIATGHPKEVGGDVLAATAQFIT